MLSRKVIFVVFVIKMNMQIANEDMTILEKMRNVPSKETRKRLER